MATKVIPVMSRYLRRPTSVDVLVSVWWVVLIGTAITGLVGFPSNKLSTELGYETSRYVVSGCLLILSCIGLLARFLKETKAEASACYGTAVFTIIHAGILIFIGSVDSPQTGLRIFANSFLIFAFANIIRQPGLYLNFFTVSKGRDD